MSPTFIAGTYRGKLSHGDFPRTAPLFLSHKFPYSAAYRPINSPYPLLFGSVKYAFITFPSDLLNFRPFLLSQNRPRAGNFPV